MGKSISKAFKKATNNALGTIGLDKDDPTPQATETTLPATDTAIPDAAAEAEETVDTASDQKKVKSAGKRNLQVSRTSGGGISI